MGKIRDISDQKFGRLTAVKLIGLSKSRKAVWLCKCDCGNSVEILSSSLINGQTKSCGCWQKEWSINKHTTHGGSKHPLYTTWDRMMSRCYNSNDRNFKNYGARGIGVYEEWRKDPNKFYAYVSILPNFGDKNRTLDRVDNNKNYEPENLRWATARQQMRNSRINKNLTFDGKTQCLSAWAEELNIDKRTINGRLRSNWSVERALTEPIHNCGRRIKNG